MVRTMRAGMPRSASTRLAIVSTAVALAACGTGGSAGVSPEATSSTVAEIGGSAPDSGCADVVAVAVEAAGGGYRFDVTVRSSDTGWEKYADVWEVRDAGGEVLATRVLTHPHETEQPFTRSVDGVEIDAGTTVEVWARDSVAGFCGRPLTVAVP